MTNRKRTSLISADDFSANQPMMALRSREHRVCFTPDGLHRVEAENSLSGVVLEIKAMSLPFILVVGTCPVRGQQNLLVDARKFEFIKVNRAFADAVAKAVHVEEDQAIEPIEEEMFF